MEVHHTGKGAAAVGLQGAIDRETVPGIRKRLLKICRKKETGDITVDLGKVTSLDTAGLALLVEVFIQLSGRGRSLRVEGANERVGRMIRLANLDRLFDVRIPGEDGK